MTPNIRRVSSWLVAAMIAGCQSLPYDSTTDISAFDGSLPVRTQTSMSDVLACTGEMIRQKKQQVSVIIDDIQDGTPRLSYTGQTVLSNAGGHFVAEAIAEMHAPHNIEVRHVNMAKSTQILTGMSPRMVWQQSPRRDTVVVTGGYTESSKPQSTGGGLGGQGSDSLADKVLNAMFVKQDTDEVIALDLALVKLDDWTEIARESGRILSKKSNNTLEVGLGYKNLGLGFSLGSVLANNLHGQQRSLTEALTASLLWRLFEVPGEQCLERLQQDRFLAIDFRQAGRASQVTKIQEKLVELLFLDPSFVDGTLNEATWRAIQEFEGEERLFPTSESNLEGLYLKMIRAGRERDSLRSNLQVPTSPLVQRSAGGFSTRLPLVNWGEKPLKLSEIEISIQFFTEDNHYLGEEPFLAGAEGELAHREVRRIIHPMSSIPRSAGKIGILVLHGGRRIIRTEQISF